jgi:hypothetical protein
VNVVHLVLFWGSLGGVVRFIFCSICCFNLIRMLSVKLLLLAISSMVCLCFSWLSLLRGSLYIFLCGSGRLQVFVLVGGLKIS